MNRLASTLLPLCAALLLGAAAASAAPLQDFDGKPRELAEFTGQGQWTVVKIWASYCAVCNNEAHAYVAFHDAHKARDARMLGISLDGADNIADAQGFIERHQLNYPNLLTDPDTGNLLYMMLTGKPLTGTPAFLVYAPDGTLLAEQVGAVPVALLEQFMADNGGASQ
jgi:peroxiredoxin